jgi:hypothetical protein
VYVDDIVFGGSSHSLVARFAKDMSKEFEMSMMRELQFFLRLQIKPAKEGTFVHQAKYTKDILKKFKMDDSKLLLTPKSTATTLNADEDVEPVDQKEYRSMIGSLLYLTATRSDIQFFVCLCPRSQASSRTSHRQAVKRIFRYLRYTPVRHGYPWVPTDQGPRGPYQVDPTCQKPCRPASGLGDLIHNPDDPGRPWTTLSRS